MTLKTLALFYTEFMSLVGKTDADAQFIALIPTYFSQNVTKIENGKTLLKGPEALIQQLKTAREYAFPWTLQVRDVVVDEQQRAVAIRFTWDTPKVGIHTTMAILKFDADNKIFEINEVYNRYAEITH